MAKIARLTLALLVFLIPVQFGLHFWPNFAFIKGIRIDYFSPTIFLTDIVASLFIISRIKEIKIKWKEVLIYVALVAVNLIVSINQDITFLRWLKITEMLLLFKGISSYRATELKDIIFRPLLYSSVTISLIGIMQVVEGKTLGGIFYYLGERNFSIFTPGIAIVEIAGDTLLRAYSTFSHPNSFAGYLLIAMCILGYYSTKEDTKDKALIVGRNLSALALFLTFSFGALVSFALSIIVGKILKFIKSPMLIITMFILFSYLLMSVGPDILKNQGTEIIERVKLANISGNIFSNNIYFGVGLGNFINSLFDLYPKYTSWLLQPVHNIFLLILTETGLLGLILAFVGFLKLTSKATTNKYLITGLLIIMISGLFDHYHLTLQQNLLINTLLFGVINSKNI